MLVQICLCMCVPGRNEGASCSSLQPNKALCCSHGLLSGCPEVPLWLQGGCFVVVNWAGPGRAGVILGKACFPPLSHSVCRSFLSSSVLISQISPEKRRCGVYCSSKEKDSLALSSHLQACGFHVGVRACVFSISPADHISFNTIALSQHKLVELVLQVIVCL